MIVYSVFVLCLIMTSFLHLGLLLLGLNKIGLVDFLFRLHFYHFHRLMVRILVLVCISFHLPFLPIWIGFFFSIPLAFSLYYSQISILTNLHFEVVETSQVRWSFLFQSNSYRAFSKCICWMVLPLRNIYHTDLIHLLDKFEWSYLFCYIQPQFLVATLYI